MTREEFTSMVRRERPRLVGIAYRFLGSEQEAEDAAQNTLLKLWTMRDEIAGIRTVESYATMIVRNLCIDVLRSKNVKDVTSIDDVQQVITESYEQSPDISLEQKEDVDYIGKIMSQLPNAQQSIMRMRHVDGLEISEIAEIMDMSEGNVRVLLSRGRQRVKELFLKVQKL